MNPCMTHASWNYLSSELSQGFWRLWARPAKWRCWNWASAVKATPGIQLWKQTFWSFHIMYTKTWAFVHFFFRPCPYNLSNFDAFLCRSKKQKLFSSAFTSRSHVIIPASGVTQHGNVQCSRDLTKRSCVYLPTLASRGWTLTIKPIISCNYDLISHPFLSTMRKKNSFPLPWQWKYAVIIVFSLACQRPKQTSFSRAFLNYPMYLFYFQLKYN